MPDLFAQISEVAPDVQERLGDIMEARAADARQKEMLKSYLSEISFPREACVLEIGCGTGAVTRTLASWPGVAKAVGIDPSATFIAKARELSKGLGNISFEVADGRSVNLDNCSFDAVVVHTTLCHVPDPQKVLAQAHRVLKPGGWLAVFDGDYATATVATGSFDPLEVCIDAFRSGFVHDQWIVRRLPSLIAAAGFNAYQTRSHGYIEAPEAGYLVTWIDRGADILVEHGRISPETAAALKAEARHRSSAKQWFGHIAFASVLARKAA
jgi:ubiquinone/menaquinone biosynthesis C-methylase UbiE